MFLKPAGALANVQKKDQPAVEMFKTYWNSRSKIGTYRWCFTFVSYRVLIHWLEKLANQLLLQVYNPTGETVGILQKIMTSLWLLHLRTSNWLCFFSDGIPLVQKPQPVGFHWTFHWDVPLEFRTCFCFSFQLGWKEIQGIKIWRESSETSKHRFPAALEKQAARKHACFPDLWEHPSRQPSKYQLWSGHALNIQQDPINNLQRQD